MKKIITATIGLLLILFYCSSCGPGYHLRKAERHIRKAELKGGKWHRDTLFKELRFMVPGADVKFSSQIITPGRPMVFQKDSVITKVLIMPGVDGRDTVYVETKCQDRVITKEVPVAINNEIKARKSLLQQWPWLLLTFAFGLFIGWRIRF